MTIKEQNQMAAWATRHRRMKSKKSPFRLSSVFAASAVEAKIAESYCDGEVAVLKKANDQGHCLIHPSTKQVGMYQATFCNDTGFLSDSQYASIQAAVRDCLLYGYRVRLEETEAHELMAQTIEAEAAFQRRMGVAA